jgi:hypothetical protein
MSTERNTSSKLVEALPAIDDSDICSIETDNDEGSEDIDLNTEDDEEEESDSDDSIGSLVNFVSDEIVKDTSRNRSDVDPTNIVDGKRTRKPIQKYVDENIHKWLLHRSTLQEVASVLAESDNGEVTSLGEDDDEYEGEEEEEDDDEDEDDEEEDNDEEEDEDTFFESEDEEDEDEEEEEEEEEDDEKE